VSNFVFDKRRETEPRTTNPTVRGSIHVQHPPDAAVATYNHPTHDSGKPLPTNFFKIHGIRIFCRAGSFVPTNAGADR